MNESERGQNMSWSVMRALTLAVEGLDCAGFILVSLKYLSQSRQRQPCVQRLTHVHQFQLAVLRAHRFEATTNSPTPELSYSLTRPSGLAGFAYSLFPPGLERAR
jgi:hypothetical protein